MRRFIGTDILNPLLLHPPWHSRLPYHPRWQAPTLPLVAVKVGGVCSGMHLCLSARAQHSPHFSPLPGGTRRRTRWPCGSTVRDGCHAMVQQLPSNITMHDHTCQAIRVSGQHISRVYYCQSKPLRRRRARCVMMASEWCSCSLEFCAICWPGAARRAVWCNTLYMRSICIG